MEEKAKKEERIVWIDYIKVFACILVVLGHLLQSLQKAGIDNHELVTNFIIWFIYLFHMPLFMAASGFLYSKVEKINSKKDYKNFVIKKLVNLGVPYLTFYIIYLVINVIFAKSVNSPKGMKELIGILNNPMSPYWFLYALFSIFLVTPILEKICRNNKKSVLFIFLALKIISLFYTPKLYLIKSIMQNGLYFYLGAVYIYIYQRK